MANRNGMGPLEQGPLTGRGLGDCREYPEYGRANGRAYGRGYGRNCRRQTPACLLNQKALLEERLNEINKQINNR